MDDASPLAGNLTVLRQGRTLLADLSDSLYASTEAGRSTVGAQYRHVLDHYHSFLRGLPDGVVDYDARDRDRRLETSRDAARDRTDAIRAAMAGLEGTDSARPLRVRLAAVPDHSGAPPHGSTVGRELLFLLSHTVHHYAIIRLLLEHRGWTCAPDFGTAPSTLAYHAATG